jgi:hypothetical protein
MRKRRGEVERESGISEDGLEEKGLVWISM